MKSVKAQETSTAALLKRVTIIDQGGRIDNAKSYASKFGNGYKSLSTAPPDLQKDKLVKKLMDKVSAQVAAILMAHFLLVNTHFDDSVPLPTGS